MLDGKKHAGTVQRRDSTPAKSIALHELCNNCTRFTGMWETLDGFEDLKNDKSRSGQVAQLCSVAHLMAHEGSCHLCHFLYASLKKQRGFRTESCAGLNVYLRTRLRSTESDGDVVVEAEVDENAAVDGAERMLFVSFVLRGYNCESISSITQMWEKGLKEGVDTDKGAFTQHIDAPTVPLRASDNLARAKGWIETCLHSHVACREFHKATVRQNERRPTRILEVTGPSSLRLRSDMTVQKFDYLALSHMWGDPSVEHIKLLLANVATFEQDVPWHKLSSIYKEAVRVTLALGYTYLWIDSLCIIQDCKADWAFEARLMATVYGNAACNLAFLFPSVSAESTMRDDPRAWNPCVLRKATSSKIGVCIHQHTSRLRAAYQSSDTQDWLVQRKWPLFGRAWTFQEYLLSPRTLLLGHRNLMWQCSAGFHDELLGAIASPVRETSDVSPKHGRDMGKSRYFPPSLEPGFGKNVVLSAPRSLSFVLDWQALLDEYRNRNLTNAKDRVIAFAGIARSFANMGDLTYLAGCWLELFPLCALWYVDQKGGATILYEGASVKPGETATYPICISEAVEHNAPSWSQFSVPVYTHHQTFFAFNDDEVFVRCKSFGDAPRVYWHDIHWSPLHSFHFPLQNPNHFPDAGFFDFTDLTVTLDMPVLPVRSSFPAAIDIHFQRIRRSHPADAKVEWIPRFTYYPDTPTESDTEPSPPRHGVLALMAEFQVCRLAGKYTIQRRLAGLVLVRGAREGTWLRVGLWKLRIKIFGVDVRLHNIREVADRWARHGMWSAGESWRMERVSLI
jgi:hypothetical protein